MKIQNDNANVMNPKNQLNLFGYKDYFDSFVKLVQKKKIPNCILFSGPKGLGKSTFCYHLVNYLLSYGEDYRYNTKDYIINSKNLSYKLLTENIHPNFFLLENNFYQKDIKIEKVRNLLNFLNKTTYSKNLKIIIIDNAEYLNLNSSNALLKAIEEPNNNTIFFIVHNSFGNISNTIKSRCIEFKLFFSYIEKKAIFQNIVKNYNEQNNLEEYFNNLHFDSPGNILRYYLFFKEKNIKVNEDTLSAIFYFFEKYSNEKIPETLFFLTFFIEKFYLYLCQNNKNNLNKIFLNYSKILNLIHSINKYNLNEKNVFITIKNTLINETK